MSDQKYYDRRIDLIFYSKSGSVLGSIVTPDYGLKPNILVKGTMIAGRTAISNAVTVTNLDEAIQIREIAWITVALRYASFEDSRTLKLRVLWSDQNKQPPDKEITFHCIEAARDVSLLEAPISVSFGKDKAKPEYTLSDVLRAIITTYNDAVNTLYSGMASHLRINSEPVMDIVDVVYNVPFTLEEGEDNIFSACSKLELRTAVVDANNARTGALSITIIDGALRASVRAEEATSALYTPYESAITIDYLVNASRRGNIITVTSLFDPRIVIGKTLRVPAISLLSKRVGGDLVSLTSRDGYIAFGADVRIDFAFGTTTQNSMIITGVAHDKEPTV